MDNAPDVNSAPAQAVPAPAPAAPAESSPAPNLQIPHKDSDAYLEWRKTGEIPEPKVSKPSKPEASASSESSAEGEQPEEKTAPGSEPGTNRQEQRRTGAEGRLQEILGDLKRAGLSPSELKSFRREAQAAKPPETTVQPPPPPEPPKPLKRPVLNEYTSWDEYNKATDDYMDQVVEQRVEAGIQRLIARQMQEQAQQQAAQKLEEAGRRYGPDAKDTIRSTATAIFNDPSVDDSVKRLVNGSPVIADLLYVMGSNGDDLSQFVEMTRRDPGAAIRNLVLLERLVQEELRKPSQPAATGQEEPAEEQPERDESGRFVSQKPAKKTTEAPPPTRELSGRASPPADEVDAAFARNDFRAFRAAANREDLARRQGR